jgi:Protein of unknown function (DUF3099)
MTYCGGVTSTPRPGFGRRVKDPVYQITGARRGVRDDVDSRARRYLVSMGVRTVCFVLAVVVDGWLRWALIVAALVLPYLSVVFANSGRERIEGLPVVPDDPGGLDRRALGGPPA